MKSEPRVARIADLVEKVTCARRANRQKDGAAQRVTTHEIGIKRYGCGVTIIIECLGRTPIEKI